MQQESESYFEILNEFCKLKTLCYNFNQSNTDTFFAMCYYDTKIKMRKFQVVYFFRYQILFNITWMQWILSSLLLLTMQGRAAHVANPYGSLFYFCVTFVMFNIQAFCNIFGVLVNPYFSFINFVYFDRWCFLICKFDYLTFPPFMVPIGAN